MPRRPRGGEPGGATPHTHRGSPHPRHRPRANRDRAPPRSRCAHPPPSSRLRSSRGDPHRPAERLPTTGWAGTTAATQPVGVSRGTGTGPPTRLRGPRRFPRRPRPGVRRRGGWPSGGR
ncbi:hypothetical protein EIZ62_18540 [Streptomyces ficellus]|uniref:Uncharacterized protein n=1 Tax=Streptomyces ficellus TaxID=1977088 RepID=A0A6I6FQX7_9ACTN|nr:hypothetical protein EIZ62_18540 [Streptomyces ficellus]